MPGVSFYNLPAVNPYLLNNFGGAAAAYALRRVSGNYAGNLLRIRRASDNTEQDIGFDANILDTAEITSFCSGTDGFVTTWYDQSGNTRNALQTSAAKQPKIYDSSTGLITDAGKPAIDFDGIDDVLLADWDYDITNNDFSAFYLLKSDSGTVGKQLSFSGSTNTRYIWLPYPVNNDRVQSVYRWTTTAPALFNIGLTPTDDYLIYSTYNSSTKLAQFIATSSVNEYFSNIQDVSTAFVSGGNILKINIGQQRHITPGGYYNGKSQEIIIYPTTQSTNRIAIQTNINNYYNIYP